MKHGGERLSSGAAPLEIPSGSRGNSCGAQVQQPLACVIVGGMLLSPICSLLVIPTFARLFMPGPKTEEVSPEPQPPEAIQPA